MLSSEGRERAPISLSSGYSFICQRNTIVLWVCEESKEEVNKCFPPEGDSVVGKIEERWWGTLRMAEIPALPLPSCVILGKLLRFSGPQSLVKQILHHLPYKVVRLLNICKSTL